MPSQLETQPEVWTSPTKAGHNDSLESIMCNIIVSYTLKGRDGSSIDFMCLTLMDPTTSWFEIMELPTFAQETTVPPAGKGKKVTFDKNTIAEPYFDKSSAQISNQVYKTRFSRYPHC